MTKSTRDKRVKALEAKLEGAKAKIKAKRDEADALEAELKDIEYDLEHLRGARVVDDVPADQSGVAAASETLRTGQAPKPAKDDKDENPEIPGQTALGKV